MTMLLRCLSTVRLQGNIELMQSKLSLGISHRPLRFSTFTLLNYLHRAYTIVDLCNLLKIVLYDKLCLRRFNYSLSRHKYRALRTLRRYMLHLLSHFTALVRSCSSPHAFLSLLLKPTYIEWLVVFQNWYLGFGFEISH